MKNYKSMRQEVLEFVLEKYGTEPEYPWMSSPSNTVLRHSSNNKWYAVLMNVSRSKLGLDGEDSVEILNVKCDPILSGSLRMQKGILPGYHMHKGNWITVLLDGTVEKEQVFVLIDLSFDLTDVKKNSKSGGKRITDWLIPANPKYYDIESALSDKENIIFTWKQSSNISVGDIVYIYVAAPISSIRYKCKAVEVDIFYKFSDDNLRMNRAMKLQLLESYEKEEIDRSIMKDHGVCAVRGPRSMPKSLINYIDKRRADDQ